MKNKFLSKLISVAMLLSMAVVPVNANTSTVNNVYNITFNKGTVSEKSNDPSPDTVLAWISAEGYTRGFSISGTKTTGTSWLLETDPAPAAGETDDKALKIDGVNADNTGLYMNITTNSFNPAYDEVSEILCGENGYTEFSFDFYTDFETNIRLSAGRFWDQNGEEVNKNTNLLYIERSGNVKLQGTTEETLDKAIYKNTWHNIKFVFKADNTYRAFLDNKPLIDWTQLSFDTGVSIRGVRDFRLYNFCSAGYTSTKYYDNFKYSFSNSAYVETPDPTPTPTVEPTPTPTPEPTVEPTPTPDPLTHSDNAVNRNFAVDKGYLFVDPDMTVAAFKAGLNRVGDVLDADGNSLTDTTMANAATLKLADTGETLTIVTATNSASNDTGSITIDNNGGITTGEWSYSYTYLRDRGYKAEIVDAFEGKDSGDKSLKITLDELKTASSQAAFLDFYPADDTNTAYTETDAPMTYAYSLYTHQEGESGNSLQGRFDATTYANGVYETDSWNRYAVTVYPNSKEYKFYVNGVLTDTGELNASVLDTANKRFRFRFQSATEGNYFVIDDVQTIYGVYEPELDVVLTEAGSDLTVKAATSSNNNADFVNTMLIIAEYDDNGRLINVANDKGTATASALECVLVNVQNKAKVKIFLWEKSSLKPIIDVKTID